MVRAREGLPLLLYSLKNVTAMLEQQGFERAGCCPRLSHEVPLLHCEKTPLSYSSDG